MTAEHPVWTGDGYADLQVASMSGEALVVRNTVPLAPVGR